jgi:phage virion morphogenesis protein
MSGVALEITETGLTEALLTIDGIAEAPTGELMEGIGRLVQEQTRRRIEQEKTSPAGAAWQPNRAGTSILFQSGALSRSIDYAAGEDSVQVGSGLVYARIHQDGGTIRPKNAKALVFQMGNQLVFARSVDIPARPYLGLSADNQNEVVEAAEDWLERLVQ